MALPVPKLDNRTFQDLVDEAKRKIPSYCPEWTDHNVSDPGITLIELFAWMTEVYIYRLNQVPDKNYVTFLNLIGASLEPATAAHGEVTFTLSATPTSERHALIPQWTEVATRRTETDEAIVFTTDVAAEVGPARAQWLLTSIDGQDFVDQSKALQTSLPFRAWGNLPQAIQGFYIGFREDLSNYTLDLDVVCNPGIGFADQHNPPWRWQAWQGLDKGWVQVDIGNDTTGGLTNATGGIELYVPAKCHQLKLQDRYEARTWLRCLPGDRDNLPAGMRPYAESPEIKRVEAKSAGITVPVTHSIPVGPQVVGISTGAPGQQFTLPNSPVLPLQGTDETIEVFSTETGRWEPWKQVKDFGDSIISDKHFVFDPNTGRIEFGPAILQSNAEKKNFGKVPPIGSTIRLRHHRVGGGVLGNVATGRVMVLKSTVPYIREDVTNRKAMTGGLATQSIEDAKLRAPSRLRTRTRAVTADDFEYLAKEAEHSVGRVWCLRAQPRVTNEEQPKVAENTVTLLVIPGLHPLDTPEVQQQFDLRSGLNSEVTRPKVIKELKDELELAPSVKELLQTYLSERCLLTTHIEIAEPDYIWLSVEAKIKTRPEVERNRVCDDVKAALYKFLHPLYGGHDGTGWPFGEELVRSELTALIQSVSGVRSVSELILRKVDIDNPLGRLWDIVEGDIALKPENVIVSYYHNVTTETE